MSAELIDICRGPMPNIGGARFVAGRKRVLTDYSEFDPVPNVNRKDKVNRVSILSKDKLQRIDENIIDKSKDVKISSMNNILLFFERKATIVILSFIALMTIAWAIASTGQRYQLNERWILDTHTGAVGIINEAPRIWPEK